MRDWGLTSPLLTARQQFKAIHRHVWAGKLTISHISMSHLADCCRRHWSTTCHVNKPQTWLRSVFSRRQRSTYRHVKHLIKPLVRSHQQCILVVHTINELGTVNEMHQVDTHLPKSQKYYKLLGDWPSVGRPIGYNLPLQLLKVFHKPLRHIIDLKLNFKKRYHRSYRNLPKQSQYDILPISCNPQCKL